MIETPRTDNFIADNDIFCDSKELLLFTNFAARLETELAEARAEIERKDKLIEQMREALRLALPEARSTHVEWAIKIALKAEREYNK